MKTQVSHRKDTQSFPNCTLLIPPHGSHLVTMRSDHQDTCQVYICLQRLEHTFHTNNFLHSVSAYLSLNTSSTYTCSICRTQHSSALFCSTPCTRPDAQSVLECSPPVSFLNLYYKTQRIGALALNLYKIRTISEYKCLQGEFFLKHSDFTHSWANSSVQCVLGFK